MGEQVVIERRFRGPPDSAHGGYTCGLVAERVEAPCTTVSLRMPPPLEQPLDVHRGDDGTVALRAAGNVVAEGGPMDAQLDVPAPVSLHEAREASAGSPWRARHPFPGCFGCGPERSQDDAIAVVMGPVTGRDVFAAPWTPRPDFAGEDGILAPRFVWAALDCPTGSVAVRFDVPAVLARLTARLVEPIVAGRPHTVVAWLIGRDGRKHHGGAAIHGPDGELCAWSVGLWIELRDPTSVGAAT
jgi:hypothetical protein